MWYIIIGSGSNRIKEQVDNNFTQAADFIKWYLWGRNKGNVQP